MTRFLFLLFLAIPLLAIVPIKPREVGENPGFSGEVSGSFETKRGNTDKDNYAASFKVQYDSNASDLVWGMMRGEYGESSGRKDTNNLFSHLRYIHNLKSKNLAAEAYVQMEGNEFKSIKDRALGGAGLRWKALGGGQEWGGLFLGLGGYYEYIGYSTQIDPLERNVRLNAYLAYTLPFANDGVFTAVGYYQPEATNGNDYYVSTSARIELHIYRQLFIAFRVGYTHDSMPALNVKKDDFAQRTLFSYKF